MHLGMCAVPCPRLLLIPIQPALHALGVVTPLRETQVSLPSLIFLAHEPKYMFSLPVLTTFFPTILSCIQLNVALDEVLSILLSTFASLRSVSPRPELSVDLIVPLVHLLPPVSGFH